jgi:hypothetical protein
VWFLVLNRAPVVSTSGCLKKRKKNRTKMFQSKEKIEFKKPVAYRGYGSDVMPTNRMSGEAGKNFCVT